MELFKLAAKLTLDSSEFNKGIGQAESAGKQLAGKMSAMTIAAGNIIAKYAEQAISAVTGLFKSAYNGYADYEQLIGGVETLFKDSADTVRQYAMQSFKTTGLSANEYMRTVTSFSASLMQGLGDKTEAAAEIANMAMVDMADNANKMGTDMSSIQNAYMGFAKQNYTLLDNLKLGYGGTAKEMIRLINDSGILEKKIDKLDDVTFDQMIQAIHVIQGEMGITGTTAVEAEHTISGSFASLKASFIDALTAIGSGDMAWIDTALTNFKGTFKAWLENSIPNAIRSLAGMDDMAQAIVDAIVNIDPAKIQQFLSTGLTTATGLVQAGRTLVRSLIGTMGDTLHSWALDPSDVRDFSKSIGEFLGSAIRDIVTNLPTILGDIFTLGINLGGGLVDGLFSALFGPDDYAEKYAKELKGNLEDIQNSTSRAGAILDYMDSLYKKDGLAAKNTRAWKTALEELERVMPGAGRIIQQHGNDIGAALSELKDMNKELEKTAVINAFLKTQEDLNADIGEHEKNIYSAQTQINIRQSEIRAQQETLTKGLRQALGDIVTGVENRLPSFIPGGDEDLYEVNRSKALYYQHLFDELDISSEEGMENYHEILEYVNSTLPMIGKSKNDYDFADSNRVKAIEKKIGELEAEIAPYQKTVETQQKELVSLFQQRDEIITAISSYNEAINTGADEYAVAGANAAAAVQTLADDINSVEIPDVVGGGGEDYAPEATGLGWVPYDGFRAKLHRGERVLTSAENAEYSRGGYRGGMDYDRVGAMIGSAINEAMGRIGVYLGAEKVADMTSRRTGKNIRVNSNARLKAMGG